MEKPPIIPYESKSAPNDYGLGRLGHLHGLVGITAILAGGLFLLVNVRIDGSEFESQPLTDIGRDFSLYFILLGIATICQALLLGWRLGRKVSLTIAIANLIFIPIGTIVGIYTILVLRRPEVVAQYREAELK